jgi:hypothetical protein
MNKRIIYPNDDGGVAVIIPASEVRRQVLVSDAVFETVVVPATNEVEEHEEHRIIVPAVYRDETDDEFAAWVAAKDVPEGKPFKIVDVADVPSDRTFRNAWEYTA